jgi:hypothetical protein
MSPTSMTETELARSDLSAFTDTRLLHQKTPRTELVRACVCVRVRMRMCVRVCVCVRACVRVAFLHL